MFGGIVLATERSLLKESLEAMRGFRRNIAKDGKGAPLMKAKSEEVRAESRISTVERSRSQRLEGSAAEEQSAESREQSLAKRLAMAAWTGEEIEAEIQHPLSREGKHLSTAVTTSYRSYEEELKVSPLAPSSSLSDPARQQAAEPASPQKEEPAATVDENGASGSDHVDSKIPNIDGFPGFIRRFQATSLGRCFLVTVFVFIFAGLIQGASMEYGHDIFSLFQNIDWDQELNVAFIGNAYLFVNDVPRVMEAISDNHIHQNSVLHPGGSLGSLYVHFVGVFAVFLIPF